MSAAQYEIVPEFRACSKEGLLIDEINHPAFGVQIIENGRHRGFRMVARSLGKVICILAPGNIIPDAS